jgi:hypothetical protein
MKKNPLIGVPALNVAGSLSMKAAVVSAEFADSVNARKLKTYQDTKKPA